MRVVFVGLIIHMRVFVFMLRARNKDKLLPGATDRLIVRIKMTHTGA